MQAFEGCCQQPKILSRHGRLKTAACSLKEAQVRATRPNDSTASWSECEFPAALAEIEDGTVLTFKFTLHGGVEGSTEQVVSKVAVFKTTAYA